MKIKLLIDNIKNLNLEGLKIIARKRSLVLVNLNINKSYLEVL